MRWGDSGAKLLANESNRLPAQGQAQELKAEKMPLSYMLIDAIACPILLEGKKKKATFGTFTSILL